MMGGDWTGDQVTPKADVVLVFTDGSKCKTLPVSAVADLGANGRVVSMPKTRQRTHLLRTSWGPSRQ